MFLTANVFNLNILGQNEKTLSYFWGVMSCLYIYMYMNWVGIERWKGDWKWEHNWDFISWIWGGWNNCWADVGILLISKQRQNVYSSRYMNTNLMTVILNWIFSYLFVYLLNFSPVFTDLLSSLSPPLSIVKMSESVWTCVETILKNGQAKAILCHSESCTSCYTNWMSPWFWCDISRLIPRVNIPLTALHFTSKQTVSLH